MAGAPQARCARGPFPQVPFAAAQTDAPAEAACAAAGPAVRLSASATCLVPGQPSSAPPLLVPSPAEQCDCCWRGAVTPALCPQSSCPGSVGETAERLGREHTARPALGMRRSEHRDFGEANRQESLYARNFNRDRIWPGVKTIQRRRYSRREGQR